jgi:hypothetical protein
MSGRNAAQRRNAPRSINFEITRRSVRAIFQIQPRILRSVTEQPYSLSFTAASLRPELCRVLAEHFLKLSDWEVARREILESNALQARAPRTGLRLERELRQRLMTLTPEQLQLLATGPADERVAMSWLAMLKYNAFVFEFAAEALRDKLAARDPILRPSDYETFIDSKSPAHPELSGLRESSRKKVREVLRRMLMQAGLLIPGEAMGALQRANPSPSTLATILNDNRAWLAGFLLPDAEIIRL